jgi:DNA-binding transcriptional ArsR family regulator
VENVAAMKADAVGELPVFKAAFFKALAHPVRIRILERLVRGDRSVQELQLALGVGQSVVSQQLAVLRTNNIVVGTKAGVSVRYAIRDPRIGELLHVARQIFDNHLVSTQGLLRQLRRERRDHASAGKSGERRARAI